ncbi:MAG: hypothetical protein QOJ30_3921 [Pseudonocardiales bacterium]|nr:hypothetical protein [Pseudonocardiales bacterium]
MLASGSPSSKACEPVGSLGRVISHAAPAKSRTATPSPRPAPRVISGPVSSYNNICHSLPLRALTCENSSARQSDSGVAITLLRTPASRACVPKTYPSRRSGRSRTRIAAGKSHQGFELPSGDGSAGSNPAGGTSVPTAKIAPHLLKQGEGRSCCVRTSLAVGGRWRASVPNTCRSSAALREQRPGLARSAAPGLTPPYEDGRRTARHRPSRPAAVLRRRAGSASTVAPAELNAATRGRRGAGFIGDEQGPLRPGWSRHPHNQTTL